MNLNLQELLEASTKVLAHQRKTHGPFVDVPQDYYWTVTSEKVPDTSGELASTGIGSLADDWMELQELFAPSAILTNLDIDRLANVIIAIGEELNGTAFHEPEANGFFIRFDLEIIQKIIDRAIQAAFDQKIYELRLLSNTYISINPPQRFDILKEEPRLIEHSSSNDLAMLHRILTTNHALVYSDIVTIGYVFLILHETLFQSQIILGGLPELDPN